MVLMSSNCFWSTAFSPMSRMVCFMIFCARSIAVSSVSASGPTGMPAILAVFSIIAGGTPSISMLKASDMYFSTQRLT